MCLQTLQNAGLDSRMCFERDMYTQKCGWLVSIQHVNELVVHLASSTARKTIGLLHCTGCGMGPF